MAKKSSATRRILFIIGGLIVLLVILGVVGSAAGWFGGERAYAVEPATAVVRPVTQTVLASQRVQRETAVQISPDASGEIIDLPVRAADRVTQGPLLARIQPDFYAAQVQHAQAHVSQS